jgi:sporulation protein YlmC with PRC-barrel domain
MQIRRPKTWWLGGLAGAVLLASAAAGQVTNVNRAQQVQQMMERHNISLTDAIRKAEEECGGKVVDAQIRITRARGGAGAEQPGAGGGGESSQNERTGGHSSAGDATVPPGQTESPARGNAPSDRPTGGEASAGGDQPEMAQQRPTPDQADSAQQRPAAEPPRGDAAKRGNTGTSQAGGNSAAGANQAAGDRELQFILTCFDGNNLRTFIVDQTGAVRAAPEMRPAARGEGRSGGMSQGEGRSGGMQDRRSGDLEREQSRRTGNTESEQPPRDFRERRRPGGAPREMQRESQRSESSDREPRRYSEEWEQPRYEYRRENLPPGRGDERDFEAPRDRDFDRDWGYMTDRGRMNAEQSAMPAPRELGTHLRAERVSALLHDDVTNGRDQKLGNIKDIVVDPTNGDVKYTVLSFGGVLGLGDKLFAVPWERLHIRNDDSLVLNVPREQLSRAPGFDKENWPNMADPRWAMDVNEFYGAGGGAIDRTVTVGGSEQAFTPAVRIVRATDLVGEKVHNNQNEELGTIRDVVVDPDRSKVAYIVVAAGGFLGIGDRLFAIPWNAVNSSDPKHLAVNIDRQRLRGVRGFTADNWPDMTDRNWALQTHEFFGVAPYWTERQPRAATGEVG